jgi:hypothetical protein
MFSLSMSWIRLRYGKGGFLRRFGCIGDLGEVVVEVGYCVAQDN